MKALSFFVAAACVSVAGCGSAETGGGRVDPALAAMVPSGTVMLAGARMDLLRETQIYKQLVANKRLAWMDEFAAATNFDPRRDVRELLIASNGEDTVLLARGSFRFAPPKGAKRSTHRGATLYLQGDRTVAIVDGSTAAAGGDRAVRRALDQKHSGQGGSAALLDKARGFPPAAQVWAVAQGWTLPKDVAPQSGNLANLNRIFRTVESATIHGDLRSSMSATARGECRTEADAKTLSDALRGLVGLGRLSVPEGRPETLRFYDGIRVEQQQRAVQVNVQVAADVVEQFLK